MAHDTPRKQARRQDAPLHGTAVPTSGTDSKEQRDLEMRVIGHLTTRQEALGLVLSSGITEDHFRHRHAADDEFLTRLVFQFAAGYHRQHGLLLSREALETELRKRGHDLEAGSTAARMIALLTKCQVTALKPKELPGLIHQLRESLMMSALGGLNSLMRTMLEEKATGESILRAVQAYGDATRSLTTGSGRGVTGSSAARLRALFGEQAWLWEGWIPLGHVTLLFGRAGMGKTFLAQEIALGVIGSIETMPDGAAPGATGKVLWIPYEGVSILPARLEATGLPDEGLIILNDIEGNGTPIPRLNERGPGRTICEEIEAWKRADDSIVLVVIDSLSSGTNDVDENSKSVSEPMTSLSSLAERLGLAILLLHHPRKSPGDDMEVHRVNLDSIRGHSSIAGVPRSILALDMPVEGRRRLRVVKNSLSPRTPDPLGYDLIEARVVTSEAPIAPEIVVGRSSKTTECADWLTGLLSEGPRLVAEIHEMAGDRGWSRDVVHRASATLGVTKRKRGFEGAWEWSLPDPE